MSDSLRDALLKLTGDLVARAEEGEPHLFLTIPLRDLESLLAAHPAEPGPLLDRAAVRSEVIRVVDLSLEKGALLPDWIVDAVMELARPMPTREQIREVLDDLTYLRDPQDFVNEYTDKVMALLDGGAS